MGLAPTSLSATRPDAWVGMCSQVWGICVTTVSPFPFHVIMWEGKGVHFPLKTQEGAASAVL